MKRCTCCEICSHSDRDQDQKIVEDHFVESGIAFLAPSIGAEKMEIERKEKKKWEL